MTERRLMHLLVIGSLAIGYCLGALVGDGGNNIPYFVGGVIGGTMLLWITGWGADDE